MNIKSLLCLGIGVVSMPILTSQIVNAAEPNMPFTQQEQLQQDRITQWERNRRLETADERPGQYIEIPQDVPTVENGASFFISKIQLEGVSKKFSFLRNVTHSYEKQSMTVADITNLRNALQRKLIDKGYVTSQVFIPEQNLKTGTLSLLVVPGYVEDIVYSAESKHIPWKNAFPIRKGELLNIRDIEQGIEQMKRVSSQSVTMQIKPGSRIGQSIVELTVQTTKPVHGAITFDNSGLDSTGKYQVGAVVSFDQVFRANDTLTVYASGDMSGAGATKGTRAQSIYYVIPSGNDTFSFSFSKSRYHQTIASIPYDFTYSGTSTTMKAKWQHVFSRSRTDMYAYDVSLNLRHNHRFINDQEIPVQALRTTNVEVGVSNRKYIGNATVYSRLGFQWGIGAFGAQPEYKASVAMGGPTSRYHMYLLDIDYRKPFMMGHRPASFTSSFHGQWVAAGKRVYSVDTINMGNRYTVHGFDGEYTLLGESGWYLRNELASVIPQLHTEVYVGLDVGAVYGPSTENLVGHTIAGTALGVRGNYPSGIMMDAFVSTPIYKPQGYKTKKVYTGFTVGYRF